MTQISFAKSRYIGDTIEGTKTTEVRRNWERWVKEFEARHDLHVYYGSRWSSNRVFVGKCKLVSVKVLRGYQFTDEDARADGLGEWLHGPDWPGEQGVIES